MRGLALFGAIALGAGVALAASDADWERCKGERGNTDAIAVCTRILSEKGLSKADRAAALHNRADAHLDIKSYDKALADINQAIATDPKAHDNLLLRGRIHVARKDHDAGISDFTDALALMPNDATVLEARGNAHASVGRYRQAITDFEAAAKQKPRDTKIMGLLGTAQYANRDYEKAVATLSRAVALGTNDPDSFRTRGNIYRETGNLERAKADYDRLVALLPDDPQALADRALIKAHMLDVKGADADCAAAFKLGAMRGDVWFACGRAKYVEGDLAAAVALMSKAIDMEPPSASNRQFRGWAYYRKGDKTAALADFEAALALESGNPSALIGRGVIRAELGETAAAAADLARGKQLAPNDVVGLYWNGVVGERRGLVAQARQDYETAAKVPVNTSGVLSKEVQVLAREALRRLDKGSAAPPAASATDSTDAATRAARAFVQDDTTGGLRATYEESHALLIGVSTYTHKTAWKDLPGVKEDIPKVQAVLRDVHKFNSVTVVSDPKSAELQSALQAFIRSHGGKTNARLVIYYAGHGHMTKSRMVAGREVGWLVPVDAPDPEKDPQQFSTVALNLRRIQEFSETMDAKHVLWVFDSCFSGQAIGMLGSRSAEPPSPFERDRLAKPVRRVITSGSATEQVPDRNSLFARLFVEALAGRHAITGARTGFVTGNELGEFLKRHVTDGAFKDGRKQTPQSDVIVIPMLESGDVIFRIEPELARTAKP